MPTLQMNAPSTVKTKQLSGFDYKGMKPEHERRLRIAKERVEGLARSSFETVIAIGNELNAVKKLVGHGQFTKWLAAEFSWKPRMARNFMSVADRFTPGLVTNNLIVPTAAYLLAAPSTPESACVEAIKRAGNGEEITVALAREIIRRAKVLDRERGQARSRRIDSTGLKHSLLRLKKQWPKDQIRQYAEELRRFAEELLAEETNTA